jgi:hypothetical protein
MRQITVNQRFIYLLTFNWVLYKVAVNLPTKLYLLHVLTINTAFGQIKELQLNFTQVQVSDCK